MAITARTTKAPAKQLITWTTPGLADLIFISAYFFLQGESYLALAIAALLKRSRTLHLWTVRYTRKGQHRNSRFSHLPIHYGQKPHDTYLLKVPTFSPFGDVEQQWIEGQDYETHGYRVGQKNNIFECLGVDPGGHLEHLI